MNVTRHCTAEGKAAGGGGPWKIDGQKNIKRNFRLLFKVSFK